MLIKNSFYLNSNKFRKNLNKTKKLFSLLRDDIENLQIPLFQSYEKNYVFDFMPSTIRKFNQFKNIVIVGMGGSILGTKAIYSFFKEKIKKEVFFFDNLDTNLNSKFKKKNIKDCCFIVVSKSGNTLETIANLSSSFSKSKLKNRLVIITEIKNSSLMMIASKFNAEIIEHKDFIGGRYSVLSEAGMFPAKLMNLNTNMFKNLNKLIHKKNFIKLLVNGVASIYTLIQQKINISAILNYDSRLNDLCFWKQQLQSESLGKKGKGFTTIVSTCPRDHHSVFQLYLSGPKDKFYTFFSSSNKKDKNRIFKASVPNSMKYLRNKKIEFVINAQCKATKNIFKKNKIPHRDFIFNKNNEEELGLIFTFFALETVLLARLMKVNPFDQPAVEQLKTETKKILLR